ncbi:hypothetical protein ACJX0J_008748, partial [Zea mays]
MLPMLEVLCCATAGRGGVDWYRFLQVLPVDDAARIEARYKSIVALIAPAELEGLLLSHLEIMDAVVIPLPNAKAGEVPIAYIVRSPDSSLTEVDVQKFIEKQVTTTSPTGTHKLANPKGFSLHFSGSDIGGGYELYVDEAKPRGDDQRGGGRSGGRSGGRFGDRSGGRRGGGRFGERSGAGMVAADSMADAV